MKSKLGYIYLTAYAVLAFLIAAQSVNAVSNDTVTVNINISSVGAIIVSPNWLSWTAGNLGSMNPGSDSLVSFLIIKNVGSVNVSNVFMNASTVSDESSNPLQTANASSFSAAGLVMVKNATDASYSHAGRIEWNLSTILTNESVGDLSGITKFSHGWYRNASGNEYLWTLKSGTGGNCSGLGTTFGIKLNPENQTNLNRDITNRPAIGCSFTEATSQSWGVVTCTDGPLVGQCIATANACDKIYIYKYYGPAPDFPTCANSNYLRKGTIVPGDEAAFTAIASVPKGTPAGDTKTGILTIMAI